MLPIKGFTITYTKNPSTIPSYQFEFYITELIAETVETDTPRINITAVSADEEKGTVTGGGEYDINSDVTLSAVANEGYVFMGWYNGDTLRYEENPLTLTRVREDAELTAKFKEQGSKADTAAFEIAASKTAVRADSTVTLSPVNAKDGNGYDVGGLTASDISWSCDTTGVLIRDDGVVSFGSDFDIDKNTEKTVTVYGKINEASSTYEMLVYSYEYYEAVQKGITSFDGDFQTIANAECIIFPTSSGSASYMLTDTARLADGTSIEFTAARNQKSQNKSFKVMSFKNSDGEELFELYYQYEGIGLDRSDLIWGALPESGSASIKLDIAVTGDTAVLSLTATNKKSQEETKTKEISLPDNSSVAEIELISESGVVSGRDIGFSKLKIEQK